MSYYIKYRPTDLNSVVLPPLLKKQFEEMIQEMVETDCLAAGVALPAATL